MQPLNNTPKIELLEYWQDEIAGESVYRYTVTFALPGLLCENGTELDSLIEELNTLILSRLPPK